MAELNYNRIILDEEKNTSLVLFNNDLCLYRCKKTVGDIKYMECSEQGCLARGKIIDGGIFTRTSQVQHSHPGNHQLRADCESAYQRLRALVRERLDQRVVSLHKVFIRDLSLEVSSFLCWENCRSTLQRVRNQLMPPCSSLEELEAYLEDEEGPMYELFGRLYGRTIYVGSVNNQMMFANLHLIDQLANIVRLYIDGTFGVTPFKARQLLVVMGDLRGQPRPLFYSIMSSQTTNDYEVIFRFLSDVILQEHREVVSVMADFEQSIRAAVRSIWPQAELSGCNFHHTQALEKNAKQCPGLAGGKLIDGTIHRKILRMFTRISLLPLQRIATGYAALLDFIQEQAFENDFDDDFDPDDFDGFIAYFEHTWFTRFLPSTWCVSDKDRRTNNNVEGHNRKIKTMIDPNPSPWEFIQGLRDLMIAASVKLEKERRTNAPPPKDLSKLTVPLRLALQRLNADEIDEIGFLDALS